MSHKPNHHHHQVPDLEQTLATMPLQTSLSSDNFKKFKPLLCPPVAELQRLSRNVIRCLPLIADKKKIEFVIISFYLICVCFLKTNPLIPHRKILILITGTIFLTTPHN